MHNQSPPDRKIPIEDLIWLANQKGGVLTFFFQCWECAPENDGHWYTIKPVLGRKALKKAMQTLAEQKLFAFSASRYCESYGGRSATQWRVANLERVNKKKLGDLWLGDRKLTQNIIEYKLLSPFEEVYGGSVFWNKELLRWEGELSHELNGDLQNYPYHQKKQIA